MFNEVIDQKNLRQIFYNSWKGFSVHDFRSFFLLFFKNHNLSRQEFIFLKVLRVISVVFSFLFFFDNISFYFFFVYPLILSFCLSLFFFFLSVIFMIYIRSALLRVLAIVSCREIPLLINFPRFIFTWQFHVFFISNFMYRHKSVYLTRDISRLILFCVFTPAPFVT